MHVCGWIQYVFGWCRLHNATYKYMSPKPFRYMNFYISNTKNLHFRQHISDNHNCHLCNCFLFLEGFLMMVLIAVWARQMTGIPSKSLPQWSWILFFSFPFCPLYPIGTSVFKIWNLIWNILLLCRMGWITHIKKAWHFSPSLESLRSSTTYSSQLQRVKPTPIGGSVAALPWEEYLKVSKFQRLQCLATSLFPILWCA